MSYSVVERTRFEVFNTLSKGDIPTPETCHITPTEFNSIVKRMDVDGLIENVTYSVDQDEAVLMAFLDNAKITVEGHKYIVENLSR